MIHKILLPLDAAPDSQQQIRYAGKIAASMNAELYLLHVATPSRHGHRSSGLAKRATDTADRMLPAHTILCGRLDETIAGYAQSIDADLILMPTRGRGLFGQILSGSTTMDVLRIADRPLWVAKPKSVQLEQPARCERILCGVALEPEGEAVLRYAARLAKACGGELLIVHAIPEISEAMLMVYGLDESGEIELLPQAAHRRIHSLAASLDVPFRVETKIGEVAAILRKFAKQWRADVVIVGRGRRTDRWQLGANIGDVIVRSPCPVITLPPSARFIRPARRRRGWLATLPGAPRDCDFVHSPPREITV
jgi:nucleotide-binding universal stress UspA family protein